MIVFSQVLNSPRLFCYYSKIQIHLYYYINLSYVKNLYLNLVIINEFHRESCFKNNDLIVYLTVKYKI